MKSVFLIRLLAIAGAGFLMTGAVYLILARLKAEPVYAPRPLPHYVFPAQENATLFPHAKAASPSRLSVRGSDTQKAEALLKFTLADITEDIESAKIVLYSRIDSNEGGTIHFVPSNDWTEETVAWNTRPPTGEALSSVKQILNAHYYEWDVTPAVTGNGTYSFSLTCAQCDSIFDSNKAEYAPYLVVIPKKTGSAVRHNGLGHVLVGAGDVATCIRSGDEETAKLIDSIEGTVFIPGDTVYEVGSREEFQACYAPTWGKFKNRTRPAAGNHEYKTPDAKPYFEYFGAAAGNIGEGYYSYDLGNWHIIVLNSNCKYVKGGCGSDSPQQRWLREDLARSTSTCTLAYWHHPLFMTRIPKKQSENHAVGAETPYLKLFWDALYDARAELVLNGHEHFYERFLPQTPEGVTDLRDGIPQIVVGTGGAPLAQILQTQMANSIVRDKNTFGVLKLILYFESYEWEFIPIGGRGFRDSGSGVCR